jgi:hypothetical protein
MNCAGITYNAGTKRVTVTYNAADLTRGASFANPYCFDDIYDTDVANGWGIFVRIGTTLYIAYCSIYIEGATTYFQNENFTLFYAPNAQETILFYARTANVYLIQTGSYVSFIINNVTGTRRFYFGGNTDLYLESVTISGFSFAYFYKSKYENIQLKNGNNHMYVDSVIDGITFINHGGYAVRGQPASATNIRLINTVTGFDIFSSATFNNVYFSPDVTYHFYYRTGINGNLILIDSNGDLTKYNIIGTADTTGLSVILKSTFSGTIENGTGGTLTIKDKDGVTVYTEVLASDDMTFQTIEYQRRTITASGGAITSNVYTISEPFTVVVTKTGYQDLTISDIEVTGGVQTIIYGKLEYLELEYPELLISAVTITDCTKIGTNDGELEITAEGGDGTYQYSIDGVTYQAGNTFTGLAPGNYTVYVRDGEGTVTDFDVTISQPIPEAYAETVLTGSITEPALTCTVEEPELTCVIT